MASFDIPRSMRALEYSAARQFSIVQKPLPKIRDHDVLIKVKACGVCGTDLHIHDGEFGAQVLSPSPQTIFLNSCQLSQFPLVPGHETVGTVAALGASVHGFTPGDRVVADNSELCGTCHYCRLGNGKELFCENFIAHGVMVDGGFAEYAVYPAARVFKFANLSDADATLIEPAACAAHGIDRIAPAMNSRVLIFGAGPTGLMLAQLLRLNGASHLVIAAPAGLKMDLARELDAADEYLVLSRDGEAADGTLEKLRGENPYGFDVVVEATGNARVLEKAMDFVSRGGKLVVYGVYDDDALIALSPNKIFKEEIQVIGSFSQMYKFPAAIDYLEKKINVRGIVNRTFKLEEWEQCLEAMRNKSVIKAAIVF
ncbi:alcohol dehydrogenase [Penicillium verhagenii]|uniref:alcohol dehydrogenase n=1 Tax=Penicillium verhagenii TaxID=1562060 RepID=UPI0025459C91|nr:alcohol dehydrogenase [Penicillium verhagenii]KAJ5927885.1 alcohol dehydrogenase [Penicillium verhagenii]